MAKIPFSFLVRINYLNKEDEYGKIHSTIDDCMRDMEGILGLAESPKYEISIGTSDEKDNTNIPIISVTKNGIQ